MVSWSPIFTGGLALHPFVILAVSVFCVGSKSLTVKPLFPAISIGLYPVR